MGLRRRRRHHHHRPLSHPHTLSARVQHDTLFYLPDGAELIFLSLSFSLPGGVGGLLLLILLLLLLVYLVVLLLTLLWRGAASRDATL